MGSKNHEVVPTPLITQISGLRGESGVNKCISSLAKVGLIARVKNAKCLSTPTQCLSRPREKLMGRSRRRLPIDVRWTGLPRTKHVLEEEKRLFRRESDWCWEGVRHLCCCRRDGHPKSSQDSPVRHIPLLHVAQ